MPVQCLRQAGDAEGGDSAPPILPLISPTEGDTVALSLAALVLLPELMDESQVVLREE